MIESKSDWRWTHFICMLLICYLSQQLFTRKDENNLGPFSQWNITGTYKGMCW